MAGGLGDRAGLPRREPRAGRRARRALLHARDAAVSVGQPAHGARPQLHARRRCHALPAPPRLHRAAPDGLRLVRAARGERGDQGRRASARDHRAQHGGDPPSDADHGVGDRLAARGLRARADLLPLDPVALPEVLRARARLSQGGAGQLVPERSDRPRERARRRRALLALRRRRRGAEHGAVVLQDHRVRRRAPRGSGDDRLARPHQEDPDQLDRHGRRARRSSSASKSSTSTSRSSRPVPTRSSGRRSS